MRNYDFSPLFRSTIGFDRLARLVDAANHVDDATVGYPPYDIEKKDENSYRISMAVAGFRLEDLTVTQHENVLIVAGKAKETEVKGQFLHHGIARRAFERRFQLADHIRVVSARLDHGILDIDLAREVPETLKPRRIEIASANLNQIAA